VHVAPTGGLGEPLGAAPSSPFLLLGAIGGIRWAMRARQKAYGGPSPPCPISWRGPPDQVRRSALNDRNCEIESDLWDRGPRTAVAARTRLGGQHRSSSRPHARRSANRHLRSFLRRQRGERRGHLTRERPLGSSSLAYLLQPKNKMDTQSQTSPRLIRVRIHR
jgi:hypothetical protein